MESEKSFTKVEVKTAADAIVLLTALIDSHDDCSERFLFGLEELRETSAKINILTDTQTRNEGSAAELNEKMAELTEAVRFAH